MLDGQERPVLEALGRVVKRAARAEDRQEAVRGHERHFHVAALRMLNVQRHSHVLETAETRGLPVLLGHLDIHAQALVVVGDGRVN